MSAVLRKKLSQSHDKDIIETYGGCAYSCMGQSLDKNWGTHKGNQHPILQSNSTKDAVDMGGQTSQKFID